LAGVKFIVVDEFSMVSLNFIALIDNRLKQIYDIAGAKKLFGNVNLIFVGDIKQLQPVIYPALYKF
jgi:hypothetical protein